MTRITNPSSLNPHRALLRTSLQPSLHQPPAASSHLPLPPYRARLSPEHKSIWESECITWYNYNMVRIKKQFRLSRERPQLSFLAHICFTTINATIPSIFRYGVQPKHIKPTYDLFLLNLQRFLDSFSYPVCPFVNPLARSSISPGDV